jgi:hypothetical protein
VVSRQELPVEQTSRLFGFCRMWHRFNAVLIATPGVLP